jgi:hypothetical protein
MWWGCEGTVPALDVGMSASGNDRHTSPHGRGGQGVENPFTLTLPEETPEQHFSIFQSVRCYLYGMELRWKEQ